MPLDCERDSCSLRERASLSFQWLHMRIQEERDRRKRESITLERLPSALEELHEVLKQGIAAYAQAFGSVSCRDCIVSQEL